jgi:hypothetical protein
MRADVMARECRQVAKITGFNNDRRSFLVRPVYRFQIEKSNT